MYASGKKCACLIYCFLRSHRSSNTQGSRSIMTEPAPSKFSLSAAAVGSKRSAEEATPTTTNRKVPKLSELKMMERAPITTRPSTSAPVNICVYKVSENAGDLWAMYKESQTKLWQVQIDHDARPSISVNIVRQFDEFLKDNARTSPGLPDSVQKLQQEAGIKLVLANTEDPDGIASYVQYRVAFYVAGDVDSLANFFMLCDGYLHFKAKQLARATPFEVHIYPYVDVDLNGLSGQMSYTSLEVHEPSANLPLKLFQAQPVQGKRVLSLYFEPEDEASVSLVITGNTWNFRDDLEKNGIAGARASEEGGAYYRFLKNVDVSDAAGKQQILSLCDIFNKQALRVVVDPKPEADTPVAEFFDELRKMSCLHFV